ncbi:MAG: lipoate--protein ligase family protein [Candidatus Aenigmarchaeota archaeon]|nr:lipoate--protein ligase family protein [Candidatus Aenigmarchaeota archaeon]
MKWRIISRELHTGSMNLGIDEALAAMVAAEKSPPTLRFYTWNPPGISLGYFQKLRDCLKAEKCNKMGIDYVRRMSGGSDVFHGTEVAYSIVAPGYMFPKYAEDAFMLLCKQTVSALAAVKINAEYRHIDQILCGEKRVGWNAVTYRGGAIIFQGSIFHALDYESIATATGSTPAKIKEALTCTKDLSSASMNDIESALQDSFVGEKDTRNGTLTRDEVQKAEELSEKYASREWTFSL